MDEIIKRVTRMEEATNAMNCANEALERALEEWCMARENFQEVQRYYYSEAWHTDMEASNTGELPKDLPQGVLSEDAIYDVMGNNHFLALDMIDAAMRCELKREDESLEE